MYCADKWMSNKPVDVTMRLLQPLLDQGYRLESTIIIAVLICGIKCRDVTPCWSESAGRTVWVFQLICSRIDFRRKGQLVAPRWFDKREVVTLSTIHQPPLTETIGKYEHRRRRTNLASVLKEVSVALVDKDVTYAPQADNVPLPMDRLKGRHFLSVCPNTEASDSWDKKAQRQCKVCADRAKTAGQTPTEREGKES
ncbi:hypothetical protein PoB_002403500 [Plakobranchus ocellatus]|uniref:Uncharacterized protein n=1 Tax=Plakobranchus ocellatus TaxID=259542 RepID=A0AAV3ZQW2_9GAST|nr:hypothetical protein PoB_002403500 [Plakobranchus ocellatus]